MRTARQLRAELRRAVLIIEAALADHDDWPSKAAKFLDDICRDLTTAQAVEVKPPCKRCGGTRRAILTDGWIDGPCPECNKS